jgi:nucleoside-diphosphate-sugar epimerase
MSMVIGKGVIATRFNDYLSQSEYLIFAGSVNDSSIQDNNIILEEEVAVRAALLEHQDILFVYFSSCSILDPDVAHTPYVQHKIRMEEWIKQTAKKFLIFRLPQVMGFSDAKSSLVNFLVDAISQQKTFEVWLRSQKNFIDIDDIHNIVGEILKRKVVMNKTLNVASTQQTSVLQFVREIEAFTGIAAKYTLVNKGGNLDIDVSVIEPLLKDINIDFGKNYILAALNKYYGHLIPPCNKQ